MPAYSSTQPFSAAHSAAKDLRTSRRSQHLIVDAITHAYAGRRVLTDISFTASPGDRIGLVGENGAGKSTLLRIIGELIEADSGTVTHAASFGMLQQELPYSPDTLVADVLDDAQREGLSVQSLIERLGHELALNPDDRTLADAFADALEAAELTSAWQLQARRGETLAGLGLADIDEDSPIGQLSGGEQLRLSLAALLLEAPATLLLDEPSNHLDDAAAHYLEQTLLTWPGIVLLASHDRTLLDMVTTRIIDFDPSPIPAAVLADSVTQPAEASVAAQLTTDPGTGFGVRVWGMNYSAMRTAQHQEHRRWQERYLFELAEQENLRHEIEVGSREVNRKHESKSESRITRKFYADKDARVVARRARNARVRLEQLERDRVRRPPEPLRFLLPAPANETTLSLTTAVAPAASFRPHDSETAIDTPAAAETVILSAHGVSFTHRLADVSFEVAVTDRLLLTGPNGSGKSTLLRILAGELAASQGTITMTPGLRIGYLPQEVTFSRPERSAQESYHALLGPEIAEQRPLTDSGLLAARDLDQPVRALSVGQRRRLALAMVIADPPPLLLLDEPSNHLSLTLVEEIDAALRDYPGAVVIATHDRWLRSTWEGQELTLVPVRKAER